MQTTLRHSAPRHLSSPSADLVRFVLTPPLALAFACVLTTKACDAHAAPPEADERTEEGASEGSDTGVDPAEDPTGETAAGAALGPVEAAAPKLDDRSSAEEAPPSPEPEASDFRIYGFVDANGSVSSNRPANHVYRGTATQPRIGELTMNLAALGIEKKARPGRLDWTMNLAAQFGPAADALVAAEPQGTADSPTFVGPETWKHIGRATAGFRTARGIEFTGGLHVSPVGIGIHWVPYNWNYTVTWELNGVPYYLAGGRLAVPISRNGRHRLEGWLVNGWQYAADNNRAPSGMLGYVYDDGEGNNVASFLWLGPERDDLSLGGSRIYSDTQFTIDRPRWGIAALVDVGTEGVTTAEGTSNRVWWMASAVFTRFRLLTVDGKRRDEDTAPLLAWELQARPEVFWDPDGNIYPLNGTLVSGTVGTSFRILGQLLVRAEYRYDHAFDPNGFFFRGDAITPDASGLAINQHTFFINVAAMFDYTLPSLRRRR